MASRLSVSGPSRTLIPEDRTSVRFTTVSAFASEHLDRMAEFNSPVCTCHLAAIGHTHGAVAVVGNGRDLPGTSSPVVVVADIRVRHGVGVV